MTSVDIVIPVYNEERDLPRCLARLVPFLEANLTHEWRVVIANNGSTDATLEVARSLACQDPRVGYVHLDQKGRGRALRRAWLESTADIVSYMDVDLSTGLEAFPKLLAALEEGYDIATGSRLIRGAHVKRSFKRAASSYCYSLLMRAMHFTSFADAQCGFKAITTRAARALVPLVESQYWFFDTELLILAQRKGCRIKEIPVTWMEDPDSRVRLGSYGMECFKGLLRMRFQRLR